ncbi:3-oxoacyl-[acyl-carrier protein] reductase [Sphaerotilus hippei]|uniref:3-oxoacyl-[acyl-carrier protein] reductase n=1 Tax=Sphaerotilus hippei TaxID=744406 RepID=A0A318H7D1_9BURK|nr:SDR family oxidoreductase [Sphaerotilus hippei]PXW98574.1 3-oxoacyl-[acyl-carrier protein] reductase [Sphaerotilus hippei]
MKKVALVTGASRGLGAVMAVALAADGWAVAVNCAHDLLGAARVVADIREAGGVATVAPFDVTDAESIEAGLEQIRAEIGPVDLIVNNATGPQPEMPIMAQSWQACLDQLHFFVKAPLLLLQAVLPDWRLRRSGRVINIGSEVAELGSPAFAPYAAAKGAMLSMTRSWASELGPEGITVNLIAPGWVPVERHAGASEAALQSYRSRVALPRMGQPQDVAAMVVFLASPGADFITGQRLAVNGGRTLG